MTEPPESPAPAVVEWGSERRGLLDRLGGWRHPALPWALAILGAVALFGSLIGEWQVVEPRVPEGFEGEDLDLESARETYGLGLILVWGVSWLIGAMLLAVCGVLTLTGQPSIRRHARTVGLAVAGVLLGVLAAAVVSLNTESIFGRGAINEEFLEYSPGRGVYAAFASVVLVGAALYLARTAVPRTRPAVPRQRTEEAGPEDLVVGPAEPLVHTTDDHTWR